MMSKTLF